VTTDKRLALQELCGGVYDKKLLIKAGGRKLKGAIAGEANAGGGVRRLDASRACPGA
jgi:hypothetical protein